MGQRAAARRRRRLRGALRAARLEFLREEPWRASPLREAERWPSEEWEEQAVRGATADDVATFVAREGEEWLGVVDGSATDRVTVDVANFWVRPADRGGGIGRSLLAAVEAWARRRGASRLALWVVETNDAAVDFYRRAGFEASETRPVQSAPGLRQARLLRHLSQDG